MFSLMRGNSCVTDSNPPHTNRPINKLPYISLRCQQVWLSIMDCSYSRKTIGFLTEDSMAKLLLRRMTSDHWWVSSLVCQTFGTLDYKQSVHLHISPGMFTLGRRGYLQTILRKHFLKPMKDFCLQYKWYDAEGA